MACSLKSPPSDLEFKGGKPGTDFLEPIETGEGLVSKGLYFANLVYSGDHGANSHWAQFVDKLKVFLDSKREPGKFTLEDALFQYGAIICWTAKPSVGKQGKGPPESVYLPVKFKLVSNGPRCEHLDLQQQGCLALLASVCGHENVEVVVGGSYAVRQNEPDEEIELQLRWNEEHLCWEADTQLKLRKSAIKNFGKDDSSFKLKQFYVSIKLNLGGVTRVLQCIYGRPGTGWLMQQQLLEAGEFADVEIVSQTSGEKIGLKCHRIQLAGASPFFAKMLAEPSNSEGSPEAKKGKWKEAESRTVALPESECAIEAMIHFMYYGGCERIFGNRVDVVLELLEAGEKYQIPGLADVSAFVLYANSQDNKWFTVDAAMKLFLFTRHLHSHFWSCLRRKGHEILAEHDKSTRLASTAFQEVFGVAVKMGPIYAALFLQGFDRDNTEETHRCPEFFPSVDPEVTRAEAELIYYFLSFGYHHEYPDNLHCTIGIMILADICEKETPDFQTSDALEFPDQNVHIYYGVDYWTELFCYARKREDGIWQQLKMGAVRMLQKCLMEHRDKVLESKQYWEMLTKDPQAFEEFTWLSHRELSEEMKMLKPSEQEINGGESGDE